jgi:hypothetical protein
MKLTRLNFDVVRVLYVCCKTRNKDILMKEVPMEKWLMEKVDIISDLRATQKTIKSNFEVPVPAEFKTLDLAPLRRSSRRRKRSFITLLPFQM